MIKMILLQHNLETIISRLSSHRNILDSLIEKKDEKIDSLKDDIDELAGSIAEKETICKNILAAEQNIKDDKKIYKAGYRVGAVFLLIASALMHYLFDSSKIAMIIDTGIIETVLPIVCCLSYIKSTFSDKRTLKKYDYDTEYSELLKFEQEKRELEYQLSEVIEKKEELVEKRSIACSNLEHFESTLNEITLQETELIKQPEELNKKFEDVMSLIRVKTAELNSEKK